MSSPAVNKKRKIAVFANGWNSENLARYMKGLTEGLDALNEDERGDIHLFLGHDAFGRPDYENKAESCIYKLPKLNEYEGAVLVDPGMDFSDVNKGILDRIKEAKIPFIHAGAKSDPVGKYVGDAAGTVKEISIYTDSYSGMKPLIDHLIEVHKIRDILFVAGPKDHKDSNERLQAVIDSCREHDVPFAEDNVYYSNWDVFAATNYIRENYSNGEKLPDVIICANDNTALYISFVLEEVGINTPEDVLLTGFDGIDRAATFYPSITSVRQPFKRMGLKTAECFGKIFKGEPVEEEYYIPCEFRLGESCGCDTTTASDIGRRKLCRLMPRDTVMAEFRAGRIHFMENAVLKSERYSTLGECLREFFYVKDGQEGNPFYIFIDPALGRLGECDVDELPAYSFSGTYDMLVGKNGPVHYEAGRYNTLSDGLIPEYSDVSPHMMVFMPLYIESFLCGYLVMSDNLEYINSLVYSKFKAALNRILETYIKNLKLSALNDRLSELLNRDPMTSVMNRVAYENCKAELTDALAVGELKEAAFVMFDVNDLKYVNDTYGHEKGDEYIKNSCSFICSYFNHSPVFRIGGDEFLAVLRGEDYNNRENILARFRDEIERLEATRKRPENRVSIACGMAGLDDITEPADITIDAVIKLADERMYDDKRKIKSRRRERK